MAELILPGTYIDVRAEALNVPGAISVGNVGILGTASKGPVNQPQLLANSLDAREVFGPYDAWGDPNSLTLVRALELAFEHGATTVFGVRTAKGTPTNATFDLKSQNNSVVKLTAKIAGSWANALRVTVAVSNGNQIVTLENGSLTEVYLVGKANGLKNAINQDSAWVDAEITDQDKKNDALDVLTHDLANPSLTTFTNGTDGADATDADYKTTLATLINEPVHIIVAAGRGKDFTDELAAHCETTSSDDYQRERIAIAGHNEPSTDDNLRNYDGARSGRLVFTGPGFKTNDSASPTGAVITLPGAFTAAALAGRLAALDPHISLTNKALNVGQLEQVFNRAELKQIINQGNILVLEQRRGTKVVRGITTSDESAWKQITTRRIVDYAKAGVRSASSSFIGKLNNERVRAALKGSINSLLADMVDREYLTGYQLDVTASRSDELRGIARVLMTLQPTFSIEFIQVTMALQ